MKQIQLTQGQVALVDDEDYVELSKYKWHAKYYETSKSYYAARGAMEKDKQKTVRMHRLIMELCGYDLTGKVVDHINHNTLDNTKNNLRVCTQAENTRNRGSQKNNTSGYKGVWQNRNIYKDKIYISWAAQIRHNTKKIHLGCFKTKEEAYKAYCDACINYHGEFAKLN